MPRKIIWQSDPFSTYISVDNDLSGEVSSPATRSSVFPFIKKVASMFFQETLIVGKKE